MPLTCHTVKALARAGAPVAERPGSVAGAAQVNVKSRKTSLAADAGSGPHLDLRSTPYASTIRFYNRQHRFHCGVDLHARTMYLCILDANGQVVFAKNLDALSGA